MSQAHTDPNRKSISSAPRWVKFFAIVTITLILLFVIFTLVGGGGGHGPGRHTSPGDAGGHTPPIEHKGQ